MVHVCNLLFSSAKKSVRRHFRGQFIDSLRLTIKGGHGGNGLPKYGGVGGQGGCVYFIAKEDVTLKKVSQKHETKRIMASSGEDSSKHRILGRRGMDVEVEVPPGVQILDDTGKVLGDLDKDGSTCLGAAGGIGGCTGTSFIGKPGESRTVTLDLKLIADIGLVGFPNAGKSTLLKAVSNASPKIASYPFTTIRPQIGMMQYEDFRTISVADLPGLIEGAHANVGMGHKFLKHIERTRLLLLMVDIFGFQLSQKHLKRNCLENVYALNKELEMYDDSLLDKPCVLLINKMDLEGSSDEYNKHKQHLHDLSLNVHNCPEEIRPTKLINFERVIPISARDEMRISDVKDEIRIVMDELVEKELEKKMEPTQRAKTMERIRERGPRIT
ncbi:unnamed protein product [Hermetia illucens]|uniref:GTP-binding protein 10 n=1 Tax=Hermetia illucens TaxID=343691 RepID=A0A7R8USY4_HERIL|nr:GTP-binding protein 10 homolog [Hermetia illucens]CAD7086466.1 unnamed protein product [Hermetia illucens]